MAVLVQKVKAAAGVHAGKIAPALVEIAPPAHYAVVRAFSAGDPLLGIGSSTGGPKALQAVMAHLPADLSAAVLIVQHMPAGFTKSLAQRLNDLSSLTVQEAADGDRLARGLALLAPGDFHMEITSGKRVKLTKDPRRNHVRPAVNITMETAAQYFGKSVLGVVLTGMGSDGTDGARLIKHNGGHIIAEDESTSVVYGMPRSVVEAGLADNVVPLQTVAHTIVEMLKNGSA